MADQGMIRLRPNFTALLPGLAAAIATLTSVVMAQAVQTPTTPGTQALIAVEAFEAVNTSLRAQYVQMVRMSGKILVFGPEAAVNAVADRWGRFVLYAPLNRLWLLDDADAVFEHAYIEVKQEPFEHLVLHWMQWRDVDIADILPAAAQLPVFTVESTTPHPLATAYDALLTQPLARATGPLPAGAYFSAGGHVFDATGAQIAEWDSYGPEIALRLIPAETSAEERTAADPLWQWLAVADLAAALTPKQPFEQGDQ